MPSRSPYRGEAFPDTELNQLIAAATTANKVLAAIGYFAECNTEERQKYLRHSLYLFCKQYIDLKRMSHLWLTAVIGITSPRR